MNNSQYRFIPGNLLGKALILLLGLAAVSSHPFAQTRGFKLITPTGEELRPFSTSWAIVVGIDKYKGKMPDLKHAVKDARGVASLLMDDLNFDSDNVIELYNRDATRENILQAFDRVATQGQEDDRVLVFFAGHGITKELRTGRERGYILPYDADLTRVNTTCISTDQLNDISEDIPAKHLYFVMDVCYGGSLFTRAEPISSETRDYMNIITSRVARQGLTAGGRDQQVLDSGPEGHSVFTYHFISGIRDRLADGNNDGIITASELAAYVAPKVTAESQLSQTPEYGSLQGSGGGDFVFLPPAPRFMLAVASSPDGAEVFVDGKSIGTTPLREHLERGTYSLEVLRAGYDPYTTEVQLLADASITAKLREGLYELAILSNPSGAEVYINGLPQEKKTNFFAKMKGGTYTIELVKEGYDSWKQTVEVYGNTGVSAILVKPGSAQAQSEIPTGKPLLTTGKTPASEGGVIITNAEPRKLTRKETKALIRRYKAAKRFERRTAKAEEKAAKAKKRSMRKKKP